jgi:hypothetical protein
VKQGTKLLEFQQFEKPHSESLGCGSSKPPPILWWSRPTMWLASFVRMVQLSTGAPVSSKNTTRVYVVY